MRKPDASLATCSTTSAAEHGGSGQPYGAYLQVVEELSRAFLTIGLELSVHTLATWAVATYASGELREEVLPAMTAGRMLGRTRCRSRAAARAPRAS